MMRSKRLDRQLHSPSAWGETVLRFALLFVPVMGLLIGVEVLVYRDGLVVAREEIRKAEQAQVVQQRSELSSELRGAIADLQVIEGQVGSDLNNPRDDAALDRVAEAFAAFLSSKQVYDHARLVNRQGREVVRVNLRDGAAVRVPDVELQDVSYDRHVRRAMELDRGEVYVSDFDLNMEHGQVEKPIRPTIRFAMPLHDGSGAARGVLLLNYRGRRLTNRLVNIARDPLTRGEGRVMLVNHQGYWLYAGLEKPDDEWGWQREGKADQTMAVQMPDLWRAINASDAGGWIEDESGLWTFETIYPLHDRGQRRAIGLNMTGEPAESGDRYGVSRIRGLNIYWKIVSFVPREVLEERAMAWRGTLLSWGALLTVASGLGCWFLSKYRTDMRRADRALREGERLAAIGEAMTGLAHESRNALQRSQACLEMLAKRVADRPEAVDLIERAQRAQTDLHYLYETVRGYAAPLRLDRRPVDLRELVSEVWRNLTEHSDRARSAKLTLEADGVETVCPADRFAIGQAVRNILENSLDEAEDARGEEGLEVRVRWAHSTLGGTPALTMSIKDNGRGLTAEQAARMFDAFYSTRVRGTGLGLAITRRIIDAHGGRIAVGEDSTRGANVLITLPREPA